MKNKGYKHKFNKNRKANEPQYYLAPEVLEELSNGLGEDEDVEELVALAHQHTELVGANPANNFIFSPLVDVIIPSPNYNPRSTAAQYGVTHNKIDRITYPSKLNLCLECKAPCNTCINEKMDHQTTESILTGERVVMLGKKTDRGLRALNIMISERLR